MNAHSPIRTYEPVTGNHYVLTEDDVFDGGKNKLGSDIRHIPLNVPLCGGCDSPLDCGVCHSCEVVNVDLEHWPVTNGDPLLRRVG